MKIKFKRRLVSGKKLKTKKQYKSSHDWEAQSNKAKVAIDTFDYPFFDTQKLADVLSKFEKKNKHLKYFIQVNVGQEIKSGIPCRELDPFFDYCTKEKKLNVIGLMVIPPNDENTKKYFKIMNDLNNSIALNELSMGMSNDYFEAIKENATFVRIGSLIFEKGINFTIVFLKSFRYIF